METPKDLKYSAEHTWIRLEGRRAQLGITDFAQSEFGDIIFVELPEIGDELKSGDPFGSVESVKSVTELYTPVSGKVVDINRSLLDLPGKVNMEAYHNWMFIMELSNLEEVKELFSAEKYAEMFGLA